MPKPYQPKYIFHVRLDSFLASIEESRNPKWTGRPIVVTPNGRIDEAVLSLNSTARRLGFRPGQPAAEVVRICPFVLQKPVDLAEAQQKSKRFFALLCRYSRNVEPRLLDEAFFESTDSNFAAGAPTDYAASIQRAIASSLGLTASIGIARTKTAAWAASQHKQPNGLTLVPSGYEREFLYPLPLIRLHSLGDRTRQFLIQHGITTIGQLASTPLDWLEKHFGLSGRILHAQACGKDETVVESINVAQTINRSLRFESPIRDHAWAVTTTLHLAKKALTTIEAHDRQPRACTIRLVDSFGRSRQKQQRLTRPPTVQTIHEQIRPTLMSLLTKVDALRSVEIEFGKFQYRERVQTLALWNGKKIQSALMGMQWRMNGLSTQIFNTGLKADPTASGASLPFAVA